MANMNMTVKTPGLAGLFNALAGGGGVNDLIQADLNRARRDQIGVATQVSQAELAAANKQAADLAALQGILADPNSVLSPEGRAGIMSYLTGIEGGLQHGPQFATGAATFTQPRGFDPGELSTMAFGTGVQPDYSKTPDGYLAGLLNALELEEMDQAGQMARHVTPKPVVPGTTSSTAPLVNPSVLKGLTEQIGARAPDHYDGAAIDPAVEQALISRASELYQQTRNLQTAVDQAFAEVQTQLQGQSDGGWFGWGANPGTVTLAPSGAPVAAPASTTSGQAAQAANQQWQEGQTIRNKETGERMVWRNGQWEPL